MVIRTTTLRPMKFSFRFLDRKVIDTRNRLIHAYFEINLDMVWDTVTDDIPPLIAAMEEVSGV